MGKQPNEENPTPGVSREKAPRTVQPHTPAVDERRGVRPWLGSLPLLSTAPSSAGKGGDATVESQGRQAAPSAA